MDCSPSGSSVRGILQARIRERVAIPLFIPVLSTPLRTLLSSPPPLKCGKTSSMPGAASVPAAPKWRDRRRAIFMSWVPSYRPRKSNVLFSKKGIWKSGNSPQIFKLPTSLKNPQVQATLRCNYWIKGESLKSHCPLEAGHLLIGSLLSQRVPAVFHLVCMTWLAPKSNTSPCWL